MKHSKKWLKITAGTLALTGAIATPIALTSCSENGPVDPVDPVNSYELAALFGTTIYPSTYSNGMYVIDITPNYLHESVNYIYFSFFKDGNSVIDINSNFETQINVLDPTTGVTDNTFEFDLQGNHFLGSIIFPENVKTIKLTYKLTNKIDQNYFGEGINYQEANCTINIEA